MNNVRPARVMLCATTVLLASAACGSGASPVERPDAAAPDGMTDDAATPDSTPSPDSAPASLKANYGHYFATRSDDTPADAAALCEHPGVTGIVWRSTWRQVEPSAGVYDFSSFDEVLAAIAESSNPSCQLWLFVEFKSFASSPELNPCPVYLQAEHSAPNASSTTSRTAYTCFLWEPTVLTAYNNMLTALGAKYDGNPRIEGVIFQESALSLNGAYSQDVADGGTYTAEAWRDALIALVGHCASSFPQSRCMSFLNFLRGGQAYLHEVSAAISAIPNNQACMSGPDLLPNNVTLFDDQNAVYEVLTRHEGCRSNSAQNDSFAVNNCDLDCIFDFAVSGTFGDFNQDQPRSSGVCVNSYLFWNHRVVQSPTGLNWEDALPVIAANPYGTGWTSRCEGGGGAP